MRPDECMQRYVYTYGLQATSVDFYRFLQSLH
jgi:hypothetical protein